MQGTLPGRLERERIKLPDRWTAVGFFALNLIRPENWLLNVSVTIAAGIAIAVSPSRTCGPGKALWEAKRSLVGVSLPLLAPLVWFGFDYLAFGDPLFSFKITEHFPGVTSAANSQLPWYAYFPAAVNSIRSQVSLFALGCAVIGAAVVCKHRPSLLILLGLPFITTVVFYFVTYVTGMALYERFFFVSVLMILVLSCIGLAWATRWLLSFDIRPARMPFEDSRSAFGKRVLVVAAVTLSLVIEHRSLPSKISGFDTFERWRISALSAAEAVRRDSDYGPSTPVIIRVEDLALVGWALRSDSRNLLETQIYKREGSRLSSDVLIAYFIINQPHQGESFPELGSRRVNGFHTSIVYDDRTTVVYKVSKTTVN